jgi:hypothetical protein
VFHIIILPSHEQENILEVSVEIATDCMMDKCPLRILKHSPVVVFQILIVVSQEPEQIIDVSREIAMVLT